MRLADEPEAVAAVLLSLADGLALRLLGEPEHDHAPTLGPPPRRPGRCSPNLRERTRDIPDARPAGRSREARRHGESTFARHRRNRGGALLIPAAAAQAATKQVTRAPPKGRSRAFPSSLPTTPSTRARSPSQGRPHPLQDRRLPQRHLRPEGRGRPALFALDPATRRGRQGRRRRGLLVQRPAERRPQPGRRGARGRQGARRQRGRRLRLPLDGPPKPLKVRSQEGHLHGPLLAAYRHEGQVVVKGKKANIACQASRTDKRRQASRPRRHEAREEARGLPGPDGQRVKAGNDEKGIAHASPSSPRRRPSRSATGHVHDVQQVDRELHNVAFGPRPTLRARAAVPRAGARPAHGLPSEPPGTALASTAPTTATAT